MRKQILAFMITIMSFGLAFSQQTSTGTGAATKMIQLKSNGTSGKNSVIRVESGSTINEGSIVSTNGGKNAGVATSANADGTVVSLQATNDGVTLGQINIDGNAGKIYLNAENTSTEKLNDMNIAVDSTVIRSLNSVTGANAKLKMQTFQFLATATDNETYTSQIELNTDVISTTSKIDINNNSEIRQSPDAIVSQILGLGLSNYNANYYNASDHMVSSATSNSRIQMDTSKMVGSATVGDIQSIMSLDPITSNEGNVLLTRNTATNELNKFETTATGLQAISSDGLSNLSSISLTPSSNITKVTDGIANSESTMGADFFDIIISNGSFSNMSLKPNSAFFSNSSGNIVDVISVDPTREDLGTVFQSTDISTSDYGRVDVNTFSANLTTNTTTGNSSISAVNGNISMIASSTISSELTNGINNHTITSTSTTSTNTIIDGTGITETHQELGLIESKVDNGTTSTETNQDASQLGWTVSSGSGISTFFQTDAQFDLTATNFNLLGNANLRNVVLNAGTTSRAPFRYSTGTLTSTIINGAKEYDANNEYLSVGGVRYTMNKVLTTTASLNFPSTPDNSSSTLTVTVTGASDGDVVSIGVPSASVVTNTSYFAFVSATNTVTVVMLNNDDINPADPAVGTFRISVSKL